MNLSDQNIARAAEDIQAFFARAPVSQRDKLKIQLVVEETFLRWQKHFGAEKDFEVQTRNRFGSPRVLIKIWGDEFNPLEKPDDALAILSAEVMQNLLAYDEARTTYRYRNGCNELNISAAKVRKPIKIPGGSVTVAILIALVASFVVKQCPQSVQDFLLNGLTVPLLDTLMKLIIAVTIPTVFISVVASVCVMENVAALSNIGFKVIRRFLALMSLIIFVSICACTLFFPVVSFSGDGNVLIGEIIALLLSAVPTNFFTPFVEGNVLQVVMIATFTGVCVVILNQRVADLKPQINAVRDLLFKMTELILKTIPLTIFLCIFKAVMTTSFAELLVVWRGVAASYITYIGVAALLLAYLKAKYKLSLTDFFRKNAPVFLIATTMLSGTASMMVNFDVCKENLKIDPNLCDFWIPLSHTLFSPGTVNVITTCAFMGAVVSDATISISQLLLIAFLAIQLSIVNPKVYGGNIAGFTILLTQLGFSTDAIGQMVLIDVFTINASSLFGMVARNCELYDLSHQVKFSATMA